MDVAVHQGAVTSLRRQAHFFRALALLLGVAVVAQAAAVLTLGKGSERIVIVPPEINGEFWIEENQVSRRYFLEWGHYVVSLLLNVTPASTDYQTEVLLRHVATVHRGAFARRLSVMGEHLRKEKLSTFFNIADVHIEPEQSRIAFVGSLASYVEGHRIEEREAAYMAIFVVNNGQLLLLEFVETQPKAAFTPLAQG